MSQDTTHGQANPHMEPEHVSVHTVHTEASSYVPQQPQPLLEPQPVLEQFAGQNPNLAIPMFQPQMVANMFQFFQQMVGAHVPPPPPPPAPIVSIEKLKRNGAQEFCGDQIADHQIAKHWQERTVRVLENLKIPIEDWGQHAISLLQDAAYDWWKRVGANNPVPVPWTTFEPLFRAEYVLDHYFDGLDEFGKDLVNTTEKRCKKFIKGMRLDLSSTHIIAPRADINDVYKKALELNEELIRKAAYEQTLLVESRAVHSGLKMGHGSKRTFSAPSNSRHDKRAKSTPSTSVAVTSKSWKGKMTYRNPVTSGTIARRTQERLSPRHQARRLLLLSEGLSLPRVIVLRPRPTNQRSQQLVNSRDEHQLVHMPCKGVEIRRLMMSSWLSKHQAIVECKERVVKLRTDDGNEVIIRGELLPKAPEFISFMQAKRLIRRKCKAFLCTVKDIRKETANHKDISVVCDFPDVFPEELPGTSRTFPYTIKFIGLLGSHALGRNPKFMATAVDLGMELVRRKIRLTYGGGNVGLQGAIASTVYTNGGIARGFIPGYIAARQVYGPTYGAEYTVSSNYYKHFEINHVVEAFIVLPGGIDTMEGLFTLISWESEGLHSKPIGLLNIDGYFNNLIKFLDDAVRQNFMASSQ
ncbi:unnamed protein product [Cuscuta campestris]|uniref:cytokinin riboside 5'-monophosphate phosphoribohydrolase n=1 Tax=Cuscuta campestris TaxID=132261 RepID=A0A484MHP4_9ASTE|nr:unnamed protein product [Cuscuta campestris]